MQKNTPKSKLEAAYKELRSLNKVSTQTEFGDTLGYNKSYFSQVMNNAEPITEALKDKCFDKFGIPKQWWDTSLDTPLLFTPKQAKNKEIITLGKHVPLRLKPGEYGEAFGDWAGLPMYNAPITASFVETYRDTEIYTPQYYLHDPRFRDCDFGAIITGDSMHSEIRHGDFIACKEITNRRFLVFGDIYYVVATNGLETCKYVNADPDNKDNLMLVAKNEKISPSPLPKDMILRMYKVRGIIRGY